jgi:hypothetical protein
VIPAIGLCPCLLCIPLFFFGPSSELVRGVKSACFSGCRHLSLLRPAAGQPVSSVVLHYRTSNGKHVNPTGSVAALLVLLASCSVLLEFILALRLLCRQQLPGRRAFSTNEQTLPVFSLLGFLPTECYPHTSAASRKRVVAVLTFRRVLWPPSLVCVVFCARPAHSSSSELAVIR